MKVLYRNNPTYWDRQARANSVDPDQMLQKLASDQGLYSLPFVSNTLNTAIGSGFDCAGV